MISIWDHNSHEVIVKLPEIVGEVWEMYQLGGIKLRPYEAVEITAKSELSFNVAKYLAKSSDGYCLIEKRRYVLE